MFALFPDSLSRFSFPILFPDSLSRFSFPILFPDEHLTDVAAVPSVATVSTHLAGWPAPGPGAPRSCPGLSPGRSTNRMFSTSKPAPAPRSGAGRAASIP